MNRHFIFALLAMLAGNVCAGGWVLVRYAETELAIHYFESIQMRKMGDTAFVWDIHDLKTPAITTDGFTYNSVGYAVEYQCRARKRRTLAIKWFEKHLGEGAVKSQEGVVSDWMIATPETLEGQLFNHVCE
ncbi:MAG: hypothetical protein K9J47_08625 [Sulfuritalea sp.]|jgi:hypothetical protein|nr:hypothetical protein [Polynucleobacter sp.]MCF8188825.1 hypothetical protein [Sulfuritalea sp.]